MLSTRIDHLVVTAASLELGVEYVHRMLGVTLETGGEHPRMGTHNCLLRLGDALFLEVIAINPDAPHPGRSRWFPLDALNPDSQPRLATWVVRTNDIHAAVAVSPIPLGAIEPMTRGQLNWLITIPEDGGLPMDGVAPVFIEWQAQPHPAAKLQNLGCSLVRLEARHAEAEKLSGLLHPPYKLVWLPISRLRRVCANSGFRRAMS
ncbi:MAG: VOC family protein [Collimonas sp.]|uniref:VOC family protein n=1 Tax=Collimonas sp. TaxID=1963772 RepID=UPI0032653CDB